MSAQSNQRHRRNSVATTPPTLYFAYGSNLSFDQMARRCPGSRFVGRGRLRGYAFQINQRGFANVIPTDNPRDYVEGLCYRLTESDERTLDRNEGVPTAYQKYELDVEFFPATADFVGRDVVEIVRNSTAARDQEHMSVMNSRFSQPWPRTTTSSRHQSQPRPDKHQRSLSSASYRYEPAASNSIAKVLVYLSTVHTMTGRPWDEYIERMEQGLGELSRQGAPIKYVHEVFRNWLRDGEGIRPVTPRRVASQMRASNRKSAYPQLLYAIERRGRERRRLSEASRYGTNL